MPFIGDTIRLQHPKDHKTDPKKRSQWILLDDLVYEAKYQTFTVKAPFETDLASVPRLLVWLVPRFGAYTRSAILHDYLWKDRPDNIEKSDADGIFRRSMREHDVPVLQRWMMWSAVGMNSAIQDRRDGKPRPGLLHELGLVAVALPSLAFVFIPAIVVQMWLFLVALLEWLALPLERIANRLKPLKERHAKGNKPEVLWKL
jgi:hypothetical protein